MGTFGSNPGVGDLLGPCKSLRKAIYKACPSVSKPAQGYFEGLQKALTSLAEAVLGEFRDPPSRNYKRCVSSLGIGAFGSTPGAGAFCFGDPKLGASFFKGSQAEARINRGPRINRVGQGPKRDTLRNLGKWFF